MVSLYSLNFDYIECSFSEKLMNVKDKKDGLSREGSGWVNIMHETGLVHSYTLECNYQTGKRVNHIPQRLDKRTNKKLKDPPI